MQNALFFVVGALSQLLLLALVLRFWLPVLRADFRNPLAQAILKLTSPLVVPLRRLVPAIGRIDTATVVMTLAIQVLVIYVLAYIAGISPATSDVFVMALLKLLLLSIKMFFYSIFIYIILSWVSPGTYNPVAALLRVIVEPVLSPFRRYIPSIGGIDISPIFAIIALQALVILIEPLRPLQL